MCYTLRGTSKAGQITAPMQDSDINGIVDVRYTGGARMLLLIEIGRGAWTVKVPVLVSDLDLECKLWLKLRLAPMRRAFLRHGRHLSLRLAVHHAREPQADFCYMSPSNIGNCLLCDQRTCEQLFLMGRTPKLNAASALHTQSVRGHGVAGVCGTALGASAAGTLQPRPPHAHPHPPGESRSCCQPQAAVRAQVQHAWTRPHGHT